MKISLNENHSRDGVSVVVEHLYPVLPVIDEVQQNVSMVVTLLPEKQDSLQDVPIDMLCILDVSPSMRLPCGIDDSESRLDACKSAVTNIIHKLSPHDSFGYIAFSDRVRDAQVFVPLESERMIQLVENGVRSLRSSGSTCFSFAMDYAKEMLIERKKITVGSQRRIIVVMVTDGESTSPDQVHDYLVMREFAEWLKQQSIGFIAIGTGHEYAASVLHDMAARAGGNSSAPHAQNVSEIEGYILSEIAYAKGACVSDVLVKIQSTRGQVFLSEVTLLSHGAKALVVRDRRECEVRTGWLGHLRQQQYLLSFDVANIPAGVHEIAKITLQYRQGVQGYEITQSYFISVECDPGLRAFGKENPDVWKKMLMAMAHTSLSDNDFVQARRIYEYLGSHTMVKMLDDVLSARGRLTQVVDPMQLQKVRSTVTLSSSATCFGTLDALPVVDSKYDPNVVAAEVGAYRDLSHISWRTTCLKCGNGYPRSTLRCRLDGELLFEALPYPRLRTDPSDPILKIVPLRDHNGILSPSRRDACAIVLTIEDFLRNKGQLFIGRPDVEQGFAPTIDVGSFAGRAVSRQQALLCFIPGEQRFTMQVLSATVPMYYRHSGTTFAHLIARHDWHVLRNADVLMIGDPLGPHAAFRVLFL
jgi:Mg-chelatase subunit ChlD